MALAKLCDAFRGENDPRLDMEGFVVDHSLRPGSRHEAEQVAQELLRLHVNPNILTLKWTPQDHDARRVESVARQLRFEAIAQACVRKSLRVLLVAHHEDDQAETVLMRVLQSYYGFGLGGIKTENHLSVMHHLYGVYESGSPRPWSRTQLKTDSAGSGKPTMLTESGGVAVLRPLLNFKKQQLTDYCLETNQGWVEDSTNADPTYALRNTMRYVFRAELLPEALRPPRLIALAEKMERKRQSLEISARDIFQKIPVHLDVCYGTATFSIPPGLFSDMDPAQEHNTKCILLRDSLLKLVSASISQTTLPAVGSIVDFVFGKPASSNNTMPSVLDQNTATLANVFIRGTINPSSREFTMCRAPPSKVTQESNIRVLSNFLKPVPGSRKKSRYRPERGWQLWDNRYWVWIGTRVKGSTPKKKVTIRFLTPELRASLRQGLTKEQRKELNNLLKSLPALSLDTIPAIVVDPIDDGKPRARDQSEVVTLPSLGWSKPSWKRVHTRKPFNPPKYPNWGWDIRYKQVDLAGNGMHRVTFGRAEKALKHANGDAGTERGHGDDSALLYPMMMGGDRDARSEGHRVFETDIASDLDESARASELEDPEDEDAEDEEDEGDRGRNWDNAKDEYSSEDWEDGSWDDGIWDDLDGW
jgi:tRNA(Ile)-lysidine synthase